MPLPAAPLSPATSLAWREARHWRERRRLERLIQRRFAAEHDARITRFLPRLFGLWQQQTPLAAVGVRHAHRAPLFQEGYLDAPAEVHLGRRLGVEVPRARIAEIGNLATARRGLQGGLFLHLIAQLAAEGVGWVLFTAIPEVANGIRRLGIEPLPLCLADPRWLDDAARRDWGRYYDRHPWVMAGDLQTAWHRLHADGRRPTLSGSAAR